MGMYGFGLMADALSKSLANIPEATYEVQKNLPDQQLKLAQATSAQETAINAIEDRPLQDLTRASKVKTLQEMFPNIPQLVKADVETKLLAPSYKGAQIKQAEGRGMKAMRDAYMSGIQITHNTSGGYQIVDSRPDSATFGKVLAQGNDIPSAHGDLQNKLLESSAGMHASQAKYYDKRAELAGTLSPYESGRLKEMAQYHRERNALLARMIELKNNPIQNFTRQAIMIHQLREASNSLADRVFTDPAGRQKIPGPDIDTQSRLLQYMRNKIFTREVENINEYLPEGHKLPTKAVFKEDPAMEALMKVAEKQGLIAPIFNWIKKNVMESNPYSTNAQGPPEAMFGRNAQDDALAAEKFKARVGMSVEEYARESGDDPLDVLDKFADDEMEAE